MVVFTGKSQVGMAACFYCTEVTGKRGFVTGLLSCSCFAFNSYQNISEPSKILSHGLCSAQG